MKTLVLALVLLTLAASGAAAWPTVVSVKPGQTADGYATDLRDCKALANTWWGDSWTGLPPPVGGAEPINFMYQGSSHPYGGLAGAGIAAWAGSEEAKRVRLQLAHMCLADRGYAAIPLTDQEKSAFSSLRSPEEQAAWLANLPAGSMSDRVSAALAAEPAPSTLARNDRFVIGAVRLDPDGLTLATGQVTAKDDVVTGHASHRLTAKLTQDFTFLGIRLEAGTELMQFLSPGPWVDGLSQHMTAWCLRKKAAPHAGILALAAVDQVWCVRASDYNMEAIAQAPQFGLFPAAIQDAAIFHNLPGQLELSIDDHDALGPLDFELVVEKLSATKVTLAAKVTPPGLKPVLIWRGAEEFDTAGRAVLPFWSRRLVLTRAGSGLTAAWENGDGRGWADQP